MKKWQPPPPPLLRQSPPFFLVYPPFLAKCFVPPQVTQFSKGLTSPLIRVGGGGRGYNYGSKGLHEDSRTDCLGPIDNVWLWLIIKSSLLKKIKLNNDSPQTNGTKSPHNQIKQRDLTEYVEKVKWRKSWDFSTVNMKRLKIFARHMLCPPFTKDSKLSWPAISNLGTPTKKCQSFLITISNKFWFVLSKRFRSFSWRNWRCWGKFRKCIVSGSRCCGLAPR